MFLLKFIDPLGLEEMFGQQTELPQELFDLITFLFMLVLLAFDLLLRLYIGKSAIKEGRGVSRRLIYVVVAVLYLLTSVLSDGSALLALPEQELTLSLLSSLVIDLTSCIAMGEIIFTSLILRRIGRNAVCPAEEV